MFFHSWVALPLVGLQVVIWQVLGPAKIKLLLTRHLTAFSDTEEHN
jgi:hypothetical protein